jgi:hypothetical protein
LLPRNTAAIDFKGMEERSGSESFEHEAFFKKWTVLVCPQAKDSLLLYHQNPYIA